jgi:hypothetical protein
MKGIRSRTSLDRAVYAVVGPLYPVLRILFHRFVTSTDKVGRAMIRVASQGYSRRHLENKDINAMAG